MLPRTQLTNVHQIFGKLILISVLNSFFIRMIATDDTLGTLGVNGLYIEGSQSTCDDLAWVISIARYRHCERAATCRLCHRMIMYRAHCLAGIRCTSPVPAQS